MAEQNAERSPAQPLVRFDVDAMSPEALGFASWQFNQYKTWFRDIAVETSDFETAEKYAEAGEIFERQMADLAQRDPDKVATAYERVLGHPFENCRRHAVNCIEAYAQVRPDKVRGFIERLISDEDEGIREHVRSKLELQFKGRTPPVSEAYIRELGLTWLEATQLLIKAYSIERPFAKEQARGIGSLGTTQNFELPEV